MDLTDVERAALADAQPLLVETVLRSTIQRQPLETQEHVHIAQSMVAAVAADLSPTMLADELNTGDQETATAIADVYTQLRPEIQARLERSTNVEAELVHVLGSSSTSKDASSNSHACRSGTSHCQRL